MSNQHVRSSSGSGVARPRSSTALSHSLQQLTSLHSGSASPPTSGSGSGASTPRRIVSRPGSPIVQGHVHSLSAPLPSSPPPSFSLATGQSVPKRRSQPPSPTLSTASISAHGAHISRSRTRSQSSTSIGYAQFQSHDSSSPVSISLSQSAGMSASPYASSPPHMFAAPGAPGPAYYAYPYFAATHHPMGPPPPPSQQQGSSSTPSLDQQVHSPDATSMGMGIGVGLRPSYSSPHIPYMLELAAQQQIQQQQAAAHAQAQAQAQHQQGMPPPYSLPYPFTLSNPSASSVPAHAQAAPGAPSGTSASAHSLPPASHPPTPSGSISRRQSSRVLRRVDQYDSSSDRERDRDLGAFRRRERERARGSFYENFRSSDEFSDDDDVTEEAGIALLSSTPSISSARLYPRFRSRRWDRQEELSPGEWEEREPRRRDSRRHRDRDRVGDESDMDRSIETAGDETDEQSRPRRPTSPISRSQPNVYYTRRRRSYTFQHRHPYLIKLFPPIILLFRLLSIVPATLGAITHIWNTIDPGAHQPKNGRMDYLVSLLWALLTARQCLAFTNGLYLRWKAYYPLVPTLIRLLALQAICWPATHFTLVTFDHMQRPLICWTIIGTTTCVSRGIQIWATSNLVAASPYPNPADYPRRTSFPPEDGHDVSQPPFASATSALTPREERRRKERLEQEERGRTKAWLSNIALFGIGVGTASTWASSSGSPSLSHALSTHPNGHHLRGKRWWDWREVGLKCAVPAIIMYFIMAWALLLRREVEWASASAVGASVSGVVGTAAKLVSPSAPTTT